MRHGGRLLADGSTVLTPAIITTLLLLLALATVSLLLVNSPRAEARRDTAPAGGAPKDAKGSYKVEATSVSSTARPSRPGSTAGGLASAWSS